MTMHTRWTICAAAALVSVPFLAPRQVLAQDLAAAATTQSHPQWVAEAEQGLAPFGPSAAVLIEGARFVAERHA